MPLVRVSNGGSSLTLLHNDASAYTFTKAYNKVYVWLTSANGGTADVYATISNGGTLTETSSKYVLYQDARVWVIDKKYLAENVMAGTTINLSIPSRTILSIFVIE